MEKRDAKELIKRYLVFIASLFFVALGISLAVKAGLGTSPISSVAYSVSLFAPISLGTCLFIWNTILTVLQIVILRKKFQKIQLLQIPLSLIFAWFTDVLKMLLRADEIPEQYAVSLIFTVVGCLCVSLGVTLGVLANVVLNSGEGFVKAVSDVTGVKFGNMKIIFDLTCVALAAVISLIFTNRILGIREGTLIAAVFTGMMVKVYMKAFKKLEERYGLLNLIK